MQIAGAPISIRPRTRSGWSTVTCWARDPPPEVPTSQDHRGQAHRAARSCHRRGVVQRVSPSAGLRARPRRRRAGRARRDAGCGEAAARDGRAAMRFTLTRAGAAPVRLAELVDRQLDTRREGDSSHQRRMSGGGCGHWSGGAVWASNRATEPRTVTLWSAKWLASSPFRPARSSRSLWKMPRVVQAHERASGLRRVRAFGQDRAAEHSATGAKPRRRHWRTRPPWLASRRVGSAEEVFRPTESKALAGTGRCSSTLARTVCGW